MKKKAIVLLSGGLDSAVVLALALKENRDCFCISFDYGQRHKIELEYAIKIAEHYKVSHKIIKIDSSIFQNTALVANSSIAVAKNRTQEEMVKNPIPSTYVPARNSLFLAYAMGQAEILGAEEIYTGPNLMDAIPYPDCRPGFIAAFQQLINVATKQAVEGHAPKLQAPLLYWDKKEIVRQAKSLKVPLELTWSCYDPTEKKLACGVCDACILREKAIN